MWRGKKGQSITEYAIIIGLVGSALLIMSTYFKRSIQLVIKDPVDNLGGFGSRGYTPARIQEIGIEDNVSRVNGRSAITDPYYAATSTVASNKRIITLEGGARDLNLDENTTTPERVSRSYQKIKYDQVTQPNANLER